MCVYMYRVLKRARMCGKVKAFLVGKNQSKTTVLMKDFSTKVFFYLHTRKRESACLLRRENLSGTDTHTLSRSFSLVIVSTVVIISYRTSCLKISRRFR